MALIFFSLTLILVTLFGIAALEIDPASALGVKLGLKVYPKARPRTQEPNNKEYCFAAKRKYSILPGESFGTLPESLRGAYMDARCYRFFCQPNKMGGKGVFKCIPLEEI
jgi:hypothetical protein